MTDNVISLTKPKDRMPAGWHRHVDALRQTHADIDALRKRLQQEYRDFKDVIKEDMRPLGKPIGNRDEQKAMGRALAPRKRRAGCADAVGTRKRARFVRLSR